MPPTRLPLLLLLLAACSRAPAGPPAGPTVTLVDSLVVSDPDTFPRTDNARSLARSTRGDLLIEVEDRILHFDRAGRFVQAIGTPGEGPGELRRISGIAVLPGDSLVAAVATARGRMVVFRLANGTVVGEVIVPEPFDADQQWIARGDTMLIPALSGAASYRRWIIGSDTARSWGEEPPSRRDGASRAYMLGGLASGEPFGDGLVVLAPADSMLVIHDASGAVIRRVLLPAIRRRPVPADAEELVREGIRRTPPEFHLPAPMTVAIHQMPDGRYLTVHFDAESTTPSNPADLGFANARYWIGIVSADLTRACVDGEIPDPPQDFIRPIFHGDTIGLFVRTLDADGEPHSVLRQYRVTDEGCGWVEMGG